MLLLEIVLGFDVFLNDSSLTRKVLDMSGFLMKIYPAITLALFCVLARTVTLHLRSIRFCIKRKLVQRTPSSIVKMENFHGFLLKVLRRQHCLVYSSIRKLNRYFGIFLALEVVYIFVGVTNCLMFVLMSAMNDDMLMGALNGAICLDQMVHLLFLASFSDGIVHEVCLMTAIFFFLRTNYKLLSF